MIAGPSGCFWTESVSYKIVEFRIATIGSGAVRSAVCCKRLLAHMALSLSDPRIAVGPLDYLGQELSLRRR